MIERFLSVVFDMLAMNMNFHTKTRRLSIRKFLERAIEMFMEKNLKLSI